MKIIMKLYWEEPGEKEEFGKIIENKDLFEAISIIAEKYKLDYNDAKIAIETYNKYIKK